MPDPCPTHTPTRPDPPRPMPDPRPTQSATISSSKSLMAKKKREKMIFSSCHRRARTVNSIFVYAELKKSKLLTFHMPPTAKIGNASSAKLRVLTHGNPQSKCKTLWGAHLFNCYSSKYSTICLPQATTKKKAQHLMTSRMKSRTCLDSGRKKHGPRQVI